MADVILNITVPDAWVTRVLNAFNTITDTHMIIQSENSRWDFRIEDKLPAENNKQFGERVLRELGKAVVNMVDYAEDTARYRQEVTDVVSPSSNVSEDILT